MKKKNAVNRIWIIAAVLFSLNLFCACGLSGTLAKYTTQVTAADTARVAAWDVEITGTSISLEEIVAGLSSYDSSEYTEFGISASVPDSHGYIMSGYRFTVNVGSATDATGALSVCARIAKNDAEGWPEGLMAALYSVTGDPGSENYTFISESTTGVFTDVKTVAPGTDFAGSYLVCFRSSAICTSGDYEVSITASMNQAD